MIFIYIYNDNITEEDITIITITFTDKIDIKQYAVRQNSLAYDDKKDIYWKIGTLDNSLTQKNYKLFLFVYPINDKFMIIKDLYTAFPDCTYKRICESAKCRVFQYYVTLTTYDQHLDYIPITAFQTQRIQIPPNQYKILIYNDSFDINYIQEQLQQNIFYQHIIENEVNLFDKTYQSDLLQNIDIKFLIDKIKTFNVYLQNFFSLLDILDISLITNHSYALEDKLYARFK